MVLIEKGTNSSNSSATDYFILSNFSLVPSGVEHYYTADVKSYTDYYAFGMTLPSRNYNQNDYKYGWQTQERTDEIAGSGNHYTAPFWEYSPRVVHRWNTDPKPNPSISPYAIMAGNPIMYTDHLGDTVLTFIDKQGAGGQGHMGMAYQNGNGEWFYASQGATNNPNNPGQGGMLAGSDAEGGVDIVPLKLQQQVPVLDSKGNQVYDKNGNAQFKTVLRNPTKDEVVQIAKSGQLGYQYDDYAQFNTTTAQDKRISQNANKVMRDFRSGRQEYNVYFNNCVDACQQIIQDKTGIDLPIDFDPRPNSYFEKLKDFESEFNKQP